MALIECKECGAEISSNAKACPKCGTGVEGKFGKFIRYCRNTVLIAVALFVIIGIVAVNSDDSQKDVSDKADAPSNEEGSQIDDEVPDISYNAAGEKLYMGETEDEINARGGWDVMTATNDVAKPDEQAKTDIAECDTDLCLIDRHDVDLRLKCRPEIEALAVYDYEWLDGMFTPWLSRGGVSPDNADYLVVFGDKLKFQNGFGAWFKVIYQCIYDMKNDQVIEVAAEQGRL